MAEQSLAGDGLQRSLVPRSRFQPRLKRRVRLPYWSAGAWIIVTSACHPSVIMGLLVGRPYSSPGMWVGTGTEGEPPILHDREVTTRLASCIRKIEVCRATT
jgi:hypothetical protein